MISKQSDAFFVLALPLNPNAIPTPLPTSPNKKNLRKLHCDLVSHRVVATVSKG
jgi:hypothetical protein